MKLRTEVALMLFLGILLPFLFYSGLIVVAAIAIKWLFF